MTAAGHITGCFRTGSKTNKTSYEKIYNFLNPRSFFWILFYETIGNSTIPGLFSEIYLYALLKLFTIVFQKLLLGYYNNSKKNSP